MAAQGVGVLTQWLGVQKTEQKLHAFRDLVPKVVLVPFGCVLWLSVSKFDGTSLCPFLSVLPVTSFAL